MKTRSIGIIGMGWVGSSVAISILHRGLCNELLINDVRPGIAEGEAMDMNHGSSFYASSHVKAASIEEMIHCQAIVITAGRGGKPDETRLQLLNENIKIVRQISDKLKGFKGILIIVANPVDVLTYFYQKFTGLPEQKVIGTGTMLDTARLRDMVGKKLDVDPRSVHANVVGEHGDSEVVLWSSAEVGPVSLRDWKNWTESDEEVIQQAVVKAAYEIIQRKGATNHAIGLVTATLLKWILRGERRIINLSTVINGPYGLTNVAISLPTLVSNEGAVRALEVGMNDHELSSLKHSAEVIQGAIAMVS